MFYDKGMDMKNIVKAKEHLKEAKELDPNNLEINLSLEWLHQTFPQV